MILQSIRYGWSKARWSVVRAFLPALLLQWILGSPVTWRVNAEGSVSLYLWSHNLGPQGQAIIIATIVLSIVGYIVSMWIDMGIIHGSVKVARGEDVAARDFFITWENVWHYIVASLLYGLLVAVGTVLLIVPGIIWGLRYSLYGYYIVTEGASPVEALQKSATATDGHKGQLFGLGLASIGVIILGALCLGIGLVWAIPTVDIAWSAVFLELSGQQPIPTAVVA